MDLAANDLEKTSAVEREAMVNKLHNMQWLKSTPNSTSLVKVKTLCKQRRSHDEDEKINDKVLAIEDSKANSVEESISCEYHLTMDTCVKDISSDPMTKKNENLCEKDMDTSNMLLDAHALIMQKVGKEEISSVATQENVITTQLEICCHIDKEQKHQESMSQNINILQDETQNTRCSSVPKSQKKDTDMLNLTERADKNNNNESMIPDTSKENTPKSENDKVSTETKNKDTCIRKTNTLKTNIKNASNTTLSKCCNDKPSTPVINSKRSLSNLSKSPMTFNNKYGKAERVANKYVFTKKNSYTKDESIRQHNCFPTKEAENKTKDIAAKSDLLKSGFEKEPDKTADINQSDKKAHDTSCTVFSNKDKTSQIHQRTAIKQFIPKSKGQEFSRSSTSTAFNRTFDKNKVPEKMEKATPVSKSSDSSLRESARKSSDKNVSNDQKNYCANRSTTFFINKNSTLSRPVKSKNMSGNVGYTPASGRNPLYARSNTTPDKERSGNTEYRAGTKAKKDYLPIDTLSNVNTKTEQLYASNLETDKNQQCEKNKDAQSANTKSSNVHKTDASILDNKNNINFTEDKKPANVEDHAKQVPVTPEPSYKNEKTINNVKTDADQQPTDADKKENNEELKPSKDSFGLYLDKSYTGSQTYPTSPPVFKPENTQQTDVNQTKNNPSIWNDLSDSLRRNISMQHSVQSIHSQQTIIQTENQRSQTSLREVDYGRFYDQCLPMSDTTRPSQISNTFDAVPYEYNMQATPGDRGDVTTMLDTMSGNRDNSNVSHRYTSNVQQRPFTPLSDLSGHSVPSSQVSRWNLSLQDGFHVEQPAATMHVYSAAAFDQDDFNGAQVPTANCLPAHHLLYTPYMQTWNSQLHYPTPVFHNPPCTSYTILPNVTNQSSNYNDANVSPITMCMHEQPQHRYIHYVPSNSNATMQMHANPSYMKDMYGCDLNNCLETRNPVVDENPIRPPNRYYKRYQDNCRTAYDVPQYATTASQPISRPQQQQQLFVPASLNQYNVYGPPGQKYYKQNTMNFTQPPPNSPKGQKMQDLVCEDNSLEDIPPIISPKEFMTSNVNFSNRTDQFTPRIFKPDFKMRPNTGYRQPFQRYSGGFRKNTYHDFPKEYTPSTGIGRGISKTSQNTKM
ncbi:uncharacterized protein LOC116841120 isoform X2 [Odontomachus brunneus]|nr:uncharacterized protein LOC116841120 isoform X2 [Odontomachus brunneus]XP_032664590.1 uncharacterized protein LOC116841120 isoform X2 [Odontomachus brunneus]